MAKNEAIFIFLFFIFGFDVYANDRGSPKTAREIAALGARAVPVVRVSYDFNGERVESHGSGFFINYHGQVITNAHVVRKEPDTWRDGPRPAWFDKHPILGTNYKYQVEAPWLNKIFEARLVALRKYKDWAKLQVIGLSSKDYDVLPLGESVELARGDEVFCLGSPADLYCSITHGIVSGLHRISGLNYIEDSIQVDAKVEGGNSGGPILNVYGEIVGVVYMQDVHFGLAMPIEFVSRDLDDGEDEMLYLGLDLETGPFSRSDTLADLFKMSRFCGSDNDKLVRLMLGLTKKSGVVVSDVVDERTLAAKVGLKRGDVICEMNGRVIKNKMHFRILQSQLKKNELMTLKVKRVISTDDGTVAVECFEVVINPSCDK